MNRALAAAREQPQAWADPNAGNVAWMESYQSSFKPLAGNLAGGLPRMAAAPRIGPCLLTANSDIVDMSWDAVAQELAVAHTDDVEIYARQGSYWVRVGLLTTVGGIGSIDLHDGSLWASTSGGGQYVPNWRDPDTVYLTRATKPVDGIVDSTLLDSNPDWPDEVFGSYQTESVPAGEFRGSYDNVSDAIADGALVGDWYHDTTADQWYEITGVGASAGNLLQFSEDLTNAVWSKVRATADDAVTLREDGTAANTHYVRQASIPLGQHTLSATITPLERRYAWLGNNSFVQDTGVIFDLESGQATSVGANVIDHSITAAPNGAWRCSVTVDVTAGNDFFDVALCESATTNVYDGDNVSRIQVERMQCTAAQYAPDVEVARWNFNNANVPRLFLDRFNEPSTQVLADTFTSKELIYSDAFSRTGIAPWTEPDANRESVQIISGKLVVFNQVTGGGFGRSTLAVETEVGAWYRFSADFTYIDVDGGVGWSNNADGSGSPDTDVLTASGRGSVTFQATATTTYMVLAAQGATLLASAEFDNVKVERVFALEGWTAEGNATLDVDLTQLRIINDDVGGTLGAARRLQTVETGKTYRFTGINTSASTGRIKLGSTAGGQEYANLTSIAPGASVEVVFIATGTSLYIEPDVNNTNAGVSRTYDQFVVELLAEPANWAANVTGVIAVQDGKLRVENNGGQGTAARTYPVEVGQWYRASVQLEDGSTGGQFGVGSTASGVEYGLLSDDGAVYFNATDPTLHLTVFCLGGGVDGLFTFADNVMVERAPALDGWTTGGDGLASVLSNLLRVENGTATRGHADFAGLPFADGVPYVLTATITNPTTQGFAVVRDGTGTEISARITTSGTTTATTAPFFATGNTPYRIRCSVDSTSQGDSCQFDDVSLAAARAIIPAYVATTDTDAGTQIFRAGSANFPRKVIVETLGSELVIYDATLPQPTMWAVFTTNVNNVMIRHAPRAVSYREGYVYAACDFDVFPISFIEDEGRRLQDVAGGGEYTFNGTIAERNQTLGFTQTDPDRTIVNRVCNDVAATVLSEVPVVNLLTATEDLTDAVWTKNNTTITGKTLVTHTDTGASLVQGISGTFSTVTESIKLTPQTGSRWVALAAVASGFTHGYRVWFDIVNGVVGTEQAIGSGSGSAAILPDGDGYRAYVTADISAGANAQIDLSIVDADSSTTRITTSGVYMTRAQLEASASGHAYVPNTGNVSEPVLTETFNADDFEILFDTFTRAAPDPWIVTAAAHSITDGRKLRWVNDGSGRGSVTNETQVVQGRFYRVTLDYTRIDADGFICVNSDANNTEVFASPLFTASGRYSFVFQADVTGSRWLGARVDNPAVSVTAEIDNVLIEEIVALRGWSTQNDPSLDVIDGAVRIETNGTSNARIWREVALETGRTYALRGNVRTTSYAEIKVTESAGAFGSNMGAADRTDDGPLSATFVATQDVGYLGCLAGFSNGEFAFFEDVFIELLEDGIGKTPSAPQLRNRTNLTLYSAEFANAVWTNTGSVDITDNAIDAPLGRGSSFVKTQTGSNSYLDQVTTLLPQPLETWCFSIFVKSTGSAVSTHAFVRVQAPFADRFEGRFSFASGEFIYTAGLGACTLVASGAEAFDDGWYRIFISGRGFSGTNGMQYLFNPTDAVNNNGPSGQLDEMYCFGAQLELASRPTAYIDTQDNPVTVTDDYGLRIPTWGVATEGGKSVGVDTGDVWDITGHSNPPQKIDFTTTDELLGPFQFRSEAGVYDIPTADITFSEFKRRYYPTINTATDVGAPRLLNDAGVTGPARVAITGGFADASPDGLTIVQENLANYFDGKNTFLTTTYNTGPMFRVEGAWANDDSSASIGEPYLLFEDFNTPNAARFRDDFDRWNPAPWVQENLPTWTVGIDQRELFATRPAGEAGELAWRLDQDALQGKWLRIRVDVRGATPGNPSAIFFNDATATGVVAQATADGTMEASVYAPPGSVRFWLAIRGTNPATDQTHYWDNVVIEEVLALDNWALGENGESVAVDNGEVSLTRETGAATSGAIDYTLNVTANTDYVFDWSVVSAGGTGAQVLIGTTPGAFEVYNSADRTHNGSPGTHKDSFNTGANTTLILRVRNRIDNTTVTVDNLSIQENRMDNPTWDLDLSGWSVGTTGSSTVTWEAGGVRLNRVDDPCQLTQLTGYVAGDEYTLILNVRESSGDLRVYDGAVVGGEDVGFISAPGLYYIPVTVKSGGVVGNLIFYVNSGNHVLDYAIVSDGLPDNSGQDNHGVVVGQITRTPFNLCTYGICADGRNYVRLIGSANSELQGWVRNPGDGTPWYLFEKAAEVLEIERDGDDYLLKNNCYAHLSLSGEPVVLIPQPLTTEGGDTITTEEGDPIVT